MSSTDFSSFFSSSNSSEDGFSPNGLLDLAPVEMRSTCMDSLKDYFRKLWRKRRNRICIPNAQEGTGPSAVLRGPGHYSHFEIEPEEEGRELSKKTRYDEKKFKMECYVVEASFEDEKSPTRRIAATLPTVVAGFAFVAVTAINLRIALEKGNEMCMDMASKADTDIDAANVRARFVSVTDEEPKEMDGDQLDDEFSSKYYECRGYCVPKKFHGNKKLTLLAKKFGCGDLKVEDIVHKEAVPTGTQWRALEIIRKLRPKYLAQKLFGSTLAEYCEKNSRHEGKDVSLCFAGIRVGDVELPNVGCIEVSE